MLPYADTNFFVRLYLSLPKSDLAQDLLNRSRNGKTLALPMTWLLELEIINAIELTVFVTRTTGQHRVTPELAAIAQTTFEVDLAAGEFLARADCAALELKAKFRELSFRHTVRGGFRTYDILHVTSALVLDCEEFWSFDQKSRNLAGLEGLRVLPVL